MRKDVETGVAGREPHVLRNLADGRQVLLETSGERPLVEVPREVVEVVNVKCPDSGEGDTFRVCQIRYFGSMGPIGAPMQPGPLHK